MNADDMNPDHSDTLEKSLEESERKFIDATKRGLTLIRKATETLIERQTELGKEYDALIAAANNGELTEEEIADRKAHLDSQLDNLSQIGQQLRARFDSFSDLLDK